MSADEADAAVAVGAAADTTEGVDATSKRLQTEAAAMAPPNAGASRFGGVDLQMPLPGARGPAVMAKVYDDGLIPHINAVVELFGVYEVNSELGVADYETNDPFGMAAEMAHTRAYLSHTLGARLSPEGTVLLNCLQRVQHYRPWHLQAVPL